MVSRRAFEVNFDGLVGLTHNYSGLSFGNVASASSMSDVSNPREAALQGLEKMEFMMALGLKQGVLPPHQRPDLTLLRRAGFHGTDKAVLEKLVKARGDPSARELLSAASSASAMWTANAAMVAPSSDTADRRVHFTPANLISKIHRSIEAETTTRILRRIF